MLLLLTHTASPANLLVNTTLGPVEGKRTDGVNLWRGLPFAAPPTGANRFRPPQPAVPWSEPRPSTREGHQCPQLDGIDRAGLIGRDGCGRIAQIDNDDLVADAVHLGKAMVGERAHCPRLYGECRAT